MELVNKHYVKISRFDVFDGQLQALEESDEKKIEYYSNLISSLLCYEKEKKIFINSIYINISKSFLKNYLNMDDVIITRQTIINAMIIAMTKSEIDIALKLQPFIQKDKLFVNELGELLNYVLDHSIDINEYFNGEEKKLIYNERNNSFEKGCIYDDEELKKYLTNCINDINSIKQKTKNK